MKLVPERGTAAWTRVVWASLYLNIFYLGVDFFTGESLPGSLFFSTMAAVVLWIDWRRPTDGVRVQ